MNDQTEKTEYRYRPRIKLYIKGLRFSLLGTVASALCGAAALMLLLTADIKASGIRRVLAYLIPAVFWAATVFQILFTVRAAGIRKRLEEKIGAQDMQKRTLFGAISFFRTREGKIADIVLLLSAVFFAVCMALRMPWGWLPALGLALLYLSLSLHCILNGKNYRYWVSVSKKRSGK